MVIHVSISKDMQLNFTRYILQKETLFIYPNIHVLRALLL